MYRCTLLPNTKTCIRSTQQNLKLAQLVKSRAQTEAKKAHTPSFKHLMNTHPGCTGVVDTRRTTILGQWSHLMSGNGAPASFWASTEPGQPPFVYLPADHRRCRSERLEEEPLRACGLSALPGPSGEVPGQSMARPGLPQPGELKTDRIDPKSGRRVRKSGGHGWVARRRRGEGAGRARVRTA